MKLWANEISRDLRLRWVLDGYQIFYKALEPNQCNHTLWWFQTKWTKLLWTQFGPRCNIKKSSYPYRDLHDKDKSSVSRLFYHHDINVPSQKDANGAKKPCLESSIHICCISIKQGQCVNMQLHITQAFCYNPWILQVRLLSLFYKRHYYHVSAHNHK